MKKIKLSIKYDELNAMYGDLHNNAIPTGVKGYHARLMIAVLTEFYMTIAPRTMFVTHKPIKLTIKLTHACALMNWIYHRERNASNYLDNFYIRIANKIDQQLA